MRFLKLNLGCGSDIQHGYLNVDKYGHPDLAWDLEQFPWPWENNSIEEIKLSHVLEHLGANTDIYINLIKEIYRVSIPNANIFIRVPHPRHDDFLHDPTHVRPITPDGLALFSRKLNKLWMDNGASNTPLGVIHDVDFEIINVNNILDEPWSSQLNNGQINPEQLTQASRQFNNVIKEYQIVLKVIK